MEYPPYLFLGILALGGVLFCVMPLMIARLWAWVFAPPKPGKIKNSPYECGIESKGDPWIRFHTGYYRYAVVFLVLDVESVFLIPIAVVLGGAGAGAVVAVLLFLLLVIEGLLWAWKKGILVWA